MKALIHCYGSIVEPDIIEALKQLNIEVILDELEIKNKVIDSDTRISSLAELILTNSPDFVFTINYFPYISSICEKLNVLYICLSVDCPVLEIYSATIRNKCNRIFLFDYAQYESVVNENPECIFYLPLATNVARWDAIAKDIVSEQKYKYDVSFIGSLYSEKSTFKKAKLDDRNRGFFDGVLAAGSKFTDLELMKEVIKKEPSKVEILKESLPDFYNKNSLSDSIINTDEYVSAYNVIGFELTSRDRISLINAIAKYSSIDVFTRSDVSVFNNNQNIHVHPGVSTHNEMPKIFKQSKINLNPTMRSIETGLPQRIWDIMGCGGLLLTNYQAEIPEYFEIGEDLLCYENNADCIELIKHYVNRDEEREAIASSGYNKVKNLHTYIIRVAQMLNTVFGE